jgi:very-short-patch-repair endonuclease
MRRFPTPMESLLWHALRDRQLGGLKFRRQIVMGHYIADFYCASARLVVELDGITHVESDRDQRRDAWMQSQGVRVLRFWNNEVMGNLSGVLECILEAAARPLPRPLPQGEGRRF